MRSVRFIGDVLECSNKQPEAIAFSTIVSLVGDSMVVVAPARKVAMTVLIALASKSSANRLRIFVIRSRFAVRRPPWVIRLYPRSLSGIDFVARRINKLRTEVQL